jgi:hypothetical protein
MESFKTAITEVEKEQFIYHGSVDWRDLRYAEVILVFQRGGRSTVYVYNAGNQVYELMNPDGYIYRMQSCAQMVDKDLTIDYPSSLGSRLYMPEGWSYRARLLENEEKMDSRVC